MEYSSHYGSTNPLRIVSGLSLITKPALASIICAFLTTGIKQAKPLEEGDLSERWTPSSDQSPNDSESLYFFRLLHPGHCCPGISICVFFESRVVDTSVCGSAGLGRDYFVRRFSADGNSRLIRAGNTQLVAKIIGGGAFLVRGTITGLVDEVRTMLR